MLKSKTISVSMTPELHEQIKTLAKENKRSASGQIRWFLMQILREYQKNPDYLKNPQEWRLEK